MANADEHQHIAYFRHGEVALLLDPESTYEEAVRRGTVAQGPPNNQPPLDADTLHDLRRLFERVGVPLRKADPGAPSDPAITGADGRVRRVLPMQRTELQVLQTVNLESWIPFPVRESRHSLLRRSIEDVTRAVERINEIVERDGESVGRYRLRAAAPNWLAMRFNA